MRQHTNTQRADMGACLTHHRQDVAPTHDLVAIECDELAQIIGNDVAVESEGLLARRRLQEGEVALLARDAVDGSVKASEVGFGSRDDGVGHASGGRVSISEAHCTGCLAQDIRCNARWLLHPTFCCRLDERSVIRRM
jgi:hypothetical protein